MLLFRNLGRIMPREALIRSLWGRDMVGVSRSLDTHIYRLRMKLALQPSNGVRLSAVYSSAIVSKRSDCRMRAAMRRAGPTTDSRPAHRMLRAAIVPPCVKDQCASAEDRAAHTARPRMASGRQPRGTRLATISSRSVRITIVPA
ncbi:helix-turn-helix domain-containing protein [Burkholderia sp. JP2-270]|uniref:winged helix-turn-helix domain-containing protein n=1 Tax=Burkholderia sp. JP2-270 TaxID=2217913 RepID=UPI001EF87EDC|nr:helix-turn-helix domain-containing protein [Burkholderia sp. JP2-270]